MFVILFFFFFFNDTATTEIYTLSLHDALPISDRTPRAGCPGTALGRAGADGRAAGADRAAGAGRARRGGGVLRAGSSGGPARVRGVRLLLRPPGADRAGVRPGTRGARRAAAGAGGAHGAGGAGRGGRAAGG